MIETSRTSLQVKLQRLIQKGHHIISAYLTLGYPDLETSIDAMITASHAGADIIEIGLPFSDPMADGPTIQYTNQYALDRGFKSQDLEYALTRLTSECDSSIVVMTYANIVKQYPITKFSEICDRFDVDGIIIPDMPPEHAMELTGLHPIYLVAPNTSLDRLQFITNKSTSFLYIVSKLGITGGDYESDPRLSEIYQYLRDNHSELPKLQGFGIDSLASVRNAIRYGADGVIIGSKLLKLLGDDGDILALRKFIKSVRNLRP